MPIPDKEWACPKCGNTESFYIESTDESPLNDDCELYHPDDEAYCNACNSAWTVRAIINKWLKKKKMTPCPCCKGTGYVEDKNGRK
jgi:hypothetical protein